MKIHLSLGRTFGGLRAAWTAVLLWVASSLCLADLKVAMMPSFDDNRATGNAQQNLALEVWGRAWGGTAPYSASLDYGDGSAPSTWSGLTEAQVSFYVGAAHTYSTGGRKVVTLTVTDSSATPVVVSRRAAINVITSPSHDNRVNMAIEKGLLFLYKNRKPSDATHIYWSTFGGNRQVAATAFSLLAFEENGHFGLNDDVSDIYASTARGGLNYLLDNNVDGGPGQMNISAQVSGNPDSNGNGLGRSLYGLRGGSDSSYVSAVAHLALVMSQPNGEAARTNTVPVGPFTGMTYKDLLTDIYDQYAYAQGDNGNRGGFVYEISTSDNGRYDGSSMGWVYLVAVLGKERWGLEPAGWYVNNAVYGTGVITHSNGGVGYSDSNWRTTGKTGSAIAPYILAGQTSSDPAIANKVKYLSDVWNNYFSWGGNEVGWAGEFYEMYGAKKGLALASIETFPNGANAGVNWYNQFSAWLLGNTAANAPTGHPFVPATTASGVARNMNGSAFGQRTDGSWLGYGAAGNFSNTEFSTPLAVLVLTRALTHPLPIAVIQPVQDQSASAPSPFILNAQASYHADPTASIVEYLWDFDSSDGVDWNHPDGTGAVIFANPGWNSVGPRTVTLRIKDDANPPNVVTVTTVVQVVNTAVPPVALPIPKNEIPKQYAAKVGETINLDGRDSYDPLGNPITAYAWDLNGDGIFGGAADSALDTSGGRAIGSTASIVFNSAYSGQISLKVTANGLSATAAAPLTVTVAASDLFVQSISTNSYTPGGTIAVSAVLKSAADSGSDASGIKVKYYAGNPFTTGIPLTPVPASTNYTVNIPHGGSVTVDAVLNVPNYPFDLYAYVDFGDTFAEYNEANNILATPIIPPNRAPVAVGDSYLMVPGAPLEVIARNGLLANDTDADLNALTAVKVSDPSNGTVTLNADGSFTYTPNGGYSGADSFQYKANDGTVDGNTVTVTLTPNPNAPVSVADSYSTGQETTLTVAAAQGVLANDRDPRSLALTASVVSNPAHGTLTLNANGGFSYVPGIGYVGTDTFRYRASNGTDIGTTTTVTIAVRARPTSAADSYAMVQGATLSVDAAHGVLANDSDAQSSPLTAIRVTAPAHGSLTLNADGSFTYTPNPAYFGADSFTYKPNNGALDGPTATVTIAISGLPTAVADRYAANQSLLLTVDAAHGVLANDTDPTASGLTAVLDVAAAHGTVSLNPNGSFTYTSADTFAGVDTFSYHPRNASGSGSQVTVSIAVNALAIAAADSYSTRQGARLSVNAGNGVLANDSDVETPRASLTAVVATQPAHGTLSLNANGSFTYDPAPDFNGTDSFTYQANDGTVSGRPGTVSIYINGTPVVVNNGLNIVRSSSRVLDGTMLGVTDVETPAAGITYTLVTIPTHGSLTRSGQPLGVGATFTQADVLAGLILYAHGGDAGASDAFSFSLSLTDGGAVAAQSFTINVLRIAGVNVAGDGNSVQESISGDGRYVVFESTSTDLVANDTNGASDIFLYDRWVGTVSLVSVNTAGTQANAASHNPRISANGRYVVFHSAADNLVANDNNNSNDIFLRDLQAGTTVRVSLPDASMPDATEGDSDSWYASISGDGRYVAYHSFAANLVPDDTKAQTDVFVFDRSNSSTRRISVSPTGAEGNQASTYPVLSEDGAYVVFQSLADNLVANDTNGKADVFRANVATGAIELVSKASDGTTQGIDTSVQPSVSADGRYVAFQSNASNLVAGDANNTTDIFVRDMQTGTLTTVSVNNDGVLGNGASRDARISDDGRFVVFSSAASNLTGTPDVNALEDVFVRDIRDQKTYLVSLSNSGAQANGQSLKADISHSGAFVSFISRSSNLRDGANLLMPFVPVGGGGVDQVYVAAFNDRPTISQVANQTVNEDSAVGPLAFTVADQYTPAGSLTVTASSSNPALIPAAGINLAGTDGNRTLSFQPLTNAFGNATITLTVSDGTYTSSTSFQLTVNPVNDSPVAGNDGYATDEDTLLTVNALNGVLANDSDVETPRSSLIVSLVTGVGHGALNLSADGSFTYLPAANWFGTDSFTYRVSDGTAFSQPATVTLTVRSVNDAPVAQNDSYVVDEDTLLAVNAASGVLNNASDVETPRNQLVVSLVTPPAYGSLSLSPDGSFTYMGSTNWNGSDSFTYRVSDGELYSAPATVRITVNPVNDAPTVSARSFTLTEDIALNVAAPGVLSTAADIDSNTLTAELVARPGFGSVVLNANGSFRYVPNSNYFGRDFFTFRVNDNNGGFSAATRVDLTIRNAPDAPIALNEEYIVTKGQALTVPARFGVLANDIDYDGDLLSAFAIVRPSHGVLLLRDDGGFTYTPQAGWTGVDVFTYVANDGFADSEMANVRLVVQEPSNRPVGLGDAFALVQNGTLSIPAPGVLANDSNPADGALSATLQTAPKNGTVTLNADGSFTYQPAAGFTGPDSFQYVASNGNGAGNVTTVGLNVQMAGITPVISQPIANASATYSYRYTSVIPEAVFRDNTGNGLRYTAEGLPDGLGFDPESRTVSGVPTTVGRYLVRIAAWDRVRGTFRAEAYYTLTVGKASAVARLNTPSVNVIYGASVPVTVVMAPASASGSVNLMLGGNSIGTATLSAGRATFQVPGLLAGANALTAVYGGSAVYNGTTSAPLTVNVARATPVVRVRSSASPSTYGFNVTLTATVAPGVASGAVTFYDGQTVVGVAPLSAGTAQISVASLSVGDHRITASYSGDSNYRGVASAVFTQAVRKAQGFVNLGSSMNPAEFGSVITLTSQVWPETATGQVQVKEGNVLLAVGNLVRNSGYAVAVFNLDTSLLRVGGVHDLTATYLGDDYNSPSVSLPLPQMVVGVGGAPVANADATAGYRNKVISLPARKLLANDTDPEGDPLSVVSVSSTSLRGGTVSLVEGVVTYIPATDFEGQDSFTYVIADNHGNTAMGTVSVAVGASSVIKLVYGPVVNQSRVLMRFQGVPGSAYTVEYAESFLGPWRKRTNITAPRSAGDFPVGVFEFSESAEGHSGFYRAVYPAY